MAANLADDILNAFSWMKSFVFRFEFHWSCSKGSNWQYASIGSGNGLAPNRRQVNTWSWAKAPPPPPPSEFLPDSNTEYTSGDTRIFSQLYPPHLINEQKHPYGIKNPEFQCFFNSVLQLIFSIFRNKSYTSTFHSSTEGTLLKCLFYTTHNARHSKDVDAL